MAARKSVLLRLDIRPAGRLCRCKHDKRHEIAKGELRFTVKESGPAARESGYCATCAIKMLDEAAERIAKLRGQL